MWWGNGQAVYPCPLRIASARPDCERWIDAGLRAGVLAKERVRRAFDTVEPAADIDPRIVSVSFHMLVSC